jgi:hypothetical protein
VIEDDRPAPEEDAGEPRAGGHEEHDRQRAPRRRFRRGRPVDGQERPLEAEPPNALEAEVLLLREENARLKAAQHQRADIGRLLDRARSLPSADFDSQSLSDDTAQMLVDGLVIRESLMEICQQIERAMVAFEARLNALASPVASGAEGPTEAPNGHGPA